MKNYYPIFLSVVFIVKNKESHIKEIVANTYEKLNGLVNDFEIILIDNGSTDSSIAIYKDITNSQGTPNIQVYALANEVDLDTCSWAGLENSLGDFVVVIDPFIDDINILPQMIEKAIEGHDIVFARNVEKTKRNIAYQFLHDSFHNIYNLVNDVHLSRDAPRFRLLSKRVINYILQHSNPAVSYRQLPKASGFSRATLVYKKAVTPTSDERLSESIDRGIKLLISTTRAPLRLVTFLSLFGAIANLIYSIYVVAVGLFKIDIAPGWVSLSLQNSGMFFLISLVLLVLGEYILQMASFSNSAPLYYVGQEFTSARLTRKEKLNIEEEKISATRLPKCEL